MSFSFSFQTLTTVRVAFNVAVYVAFRQGWFHPSWQSVVERNEAADAKQCLRVPKLWGSVAGDMVRYIKYEITVDYVNMRIQDLVDRQLPPSINNFNISNLFC